MSECDHGFHFRTFAADGRQCGSTLVSRRLLHSQDNLTPVLESLQVCLCPPRAHWRLRLAVEDTAPFDAEVWVVREELAVARLSRPTATAILVVVADAAGRLGPSDFRSLHPILGGETSSLGLDRAFDWAIGHQPPLAALAYTGSEADTGLDILGMCVALTLLDDWHALDEGRHPDE
jgi:hypothetical protein